MKHRQKLFILLPFFKTPSWIFFSLITLILEYILTYFSFWSRKVFWQDSEQVKMKNSEKPSETLGYSAFLQIRNTWVPVSGVTELDALTESGRSLGSELHVRTLVTQMWYVSPDIKHCLSCRVTLPAWFFTGRLACPVDSLAWHPSRLLWSKRMWSDK
jgi:hypothetical protein